MTAIGLLMFVLGWTLVRTYGSPYESVDMWNLCDKIGIAMVIIGFALTNIGVFIKMWDVMP